MFLVTDDNRVWKVPDSKGIMRTVSMEAERMNLVLDGCNPKAIKKRERKDVTGEVFKTHNALQ